MLQTLSKLEGIFNLKQEQRKTFKSFFGGHHVLNGLANEFN